MNIDKIPFVTMGNISEYASDDENFTIEELISKAEKEFKLACKQKNLKKKIMLLNNACLWFKKIQNINGEIPADLFFDVKIDLLKLVIVVLHDKNEIMKLYYELKEFYNKLESKDDYKYRFGSIAYQCSACLKEMGEVEEMFEIVDDILELLKDDKTDKILILNATVQMMMSTMFFETEMFSTAINWAKSAIELINMTKNKNSEVSGCAASLNFSLGNIYFQTNGFDEAIKYFEQSISICKNCEFERVFEIMHLSSNYLAQVYVCQERYNEAIEKYEEFISFGDECFEGEEYIKAKASFLFRIAFIYNKFLNDKKKKDEYLEQAFEVLDRYPDKGCEGYLALFEQLTELRNS